MATSRRKIAANRRNAKRSTGPRTPEGKAIARSNAVVHGLLSRHPLVPGEDAREFAILYERLRAELQPEGALEEELVDQVVHACWRLRRVRQVESGYYARHLAGERVDRAYAARRRYELSPLDQLGSLGALGEVTILDRDSHQAALEREAAARFDRDGPATAYVRAFAAGGEGFERLARYERSLQRALSSSLAELERLRARRGY